MKLLITAAAATYERKAASSSGTPRAWQQPSRCVTGRTFWQTKTVNSLFISLMNVLLCDGKKRLKNLRFPTQVFPAGAYIFNIRLHRD